MKYLADIFVAIFIAFFVLYALNKKTSDYIKLFITYFLPFAAVFFGADPLYLSLMKVPVFSRQVNQLFGSEAYLLGYLATEIILYVILVLVIKFVIRLFTHHKLIITKQVLKKRYKLINVFLSLVLGYLFSIILVTSLWLFGLSNDYGLSAPIYRNNLVDVDYALKIKQKMDIYEAATDAEQNLMFTGLPEAVQALNDLLGTVNTAYQEFINQLSDLSCQRINLKASINNLTNDYQKLVLVTSDEQLKGDLRSLEGDAAFSSLLANLQKFEGLASFYVNHGADWASFSQSGVTSPDSELDGRIKALVSDLKKYTDTLLFLNRYLEGDFLYEDVDALINLEIMPRFMDKESYLSLMDAYRIHFNDKNSRYLKIYINDCRNNRYHFQREIDGFLSTYVLKAYQGALRKVNVVTGYLAEKIKKSNHLAADIVDILAVNANIDLSNLSYENIETLDSLVSAFNFPSDANALLKQLYS